VVSNNGHIHAKQRSWNAVAETCVQERQRNRDFEGTVYGTNMWNQLMIIAQKLV
jgi:hypothetical protein